MTYLILVNNICLSKPANTIVIEAGSDDRGATCIAQVYTPPSDRVKELRDNTEDVSANE